MVIIIKNRIFKIAVLFVFLTAISLNAQTTSSDSIVIQYLTELGIPTTYNNEVKLLKSGTEKFSDLFEHIRQAKHHIHLEYFNFRNDSIARAVFNLLGQKAKEGVQVRALFDAFGNMSNNRPLKKAHLDSIRALGIEIQKFDPINFPWLNHVFHRDHRKIVVIDGKVGYTGGMNIADYYIKGLEGIGQWRDMHVRIEGEAVSYLQDIFLTTWNAVTKQHIEGLDYYPFRPHTDETFGNTGIAIIDRMPKKTPKIMRQIYVKSIDAAQKKIQIINPYFVPTHSIKKAIKKALKRNVKVEIMIPGKSDIKFTPAAALYTANKLRKKGAGIYIYNNGFHHSKIMMVDSLFCTVGSTNLNSRSLRFDCEVNAFIFDKTTTAELSEMFENDKHDSTLLTKEQYKKRSAWKHFIAWFAHLFTPVL
ncbi:MAG: cardiolipin synthase [Phocaeicola sp.]|uniref:cardiolipin synthase n=2 Tax=Phocaeicola sp. TaxID=2773926 RepID=UPI003F9F1BD1